MADYFSLNPLGIGTSEVECFPSYLSRLARLHGVTQQQFCTHLAQWSGRQEKGEALPASRLYDSKSALFCGVQPTLSRYLHAVEEATGSRHIDRTTLVAITAGMSNQSIGLVKRVRSWCPACLQEHLASESVVYDRLLWCLAPMLRCVFHQVELVSCCPHCSAPQHHIDQSGDLALCFRCRLPLVSHRKSWRSRRGPCFGERDCYELVTAISTGELVKAEDQAFKTFSTEIDRLFAIAMSKPMSPGVREVALYTRSLSKRNKAPLSTFPTMIRQCAGTGVRLVDVLTSPVDAARSAGGLFPMEDIPGYRPRRHSSPFHYLVSCRLKEELSKPNNQRILAYPIFTRELGVTDGYLRYRFPILTNRYKKRCREEHVVAAQEEDARVRLFLQSKLHLYPSAEFPSQDHLVAAATKACCCGVRRARTVLARLLEEKRIALIATPAIT